MIDLVVRECESMGTTIGEVLWCEDDDAISGLYKALNHRVIPEDGEPLVAAYELACMRPVRMNCKCRIPKFLTFLSMCFYLQKQHGEKTPFALSEVAIAKLFRTSQRSISDYRCIAVEEGFLRKVNGHSFTAGQPGKGRSAMFLFTGRMMPN